MGKQTRTFRQGKKSLSGNRGAQNYAKVNRFGNWKRVLWVFKGGVK